MYVEEDAPNWEVLGYGGGLMKNWGRKLQFLRARKMVPRMCSTLVTIQITNSRFVHN
ncbi:hypothetical protein Sjap_005131 [Stephania japonica]|uniref:Uncharacterized protein n=1 Tax=Stephania japonica TaxID=461633 RepID=A0AAP0K3H4_9MAGN